MLNVFLKYLIRRRSKTVIDRIAPYIKHSNRIIDIGSGTGDVAFLIKSQGKNITPVDVADFRGPRFIKTTIYDGKTLPFADQSFDTALLLMVLHHTLNPKIVFSEAKRVAKEIIIIETCYTNPIDKFFTVIFDAIANLRFEAFWNSYKSDQEWKNFFMNYRLKIMVSKKFKDRQFGIIPFLHILYYLKKF